MQREGSLSEGKDDSSPEAPFADVSKVSLVTSLVMAQPWDGSDC